MTKIWWIFNTKYEDCEKNAKYLGTKLSKKYNVSFGNIKKIKINDIIHNLPDVLVIGACVNVGRPCSRIKKFIKKLGKKLDKPVPKVAIVCSHPTEGEKITQNETKIAVLNFHLADQIVSAFNCSTDPAKKLKSDKIVEKLNEFIEK
ncbi:MAG: hypothetical protein ACTSRG_15310 [Candidatus Helarchaeota archaeon]